MRNVAHVPLVMFSWLSNKFVAEKIGIVTLMKMNLLPGYEEDLGSDASFVKCIIKKNTAYLLWYDMLHGLSQIFFLYFVIIFLK